MKLTSSLEEKILSRSHTCIEILALTPNVFADYGFVIHLVPTSKNSKNQTKRGLLCIIESYVIFKTTRFEKALIWTDWTFLSPVPNQQPGADDRSTESTNTSDADRISRQHRGRQHLSYLAGATRKERSRSISPTRRTSTSDSSERGQKKMVEPASDKSSTSSSNLRNNHNNVTTASARRQTHPRGDVTSSLEKLYASQHALQLEESMFRQQCCWNHCDRCR